MSASAADANTGLSALPPRPKQDESKVSTVMNQESSALVHKVWNYAHVLKDDGLAFMDYTEQITYLLFLKMEWEQRQAGSNEIPSRYTWGALKNINHNTNRLNRYPHALPNLIYHPALIRLTF